MPSQVRVMWKMKPSRRCSPSVRRSSPSSSCSRRVTRVASSMASRSASPSSLKVTRLRSVSASQCGRGKLPMLVVVSGPSLITPLPPRHFPPRHFPPRHFPPRHFPPRHFPPRHVAGTRPCKLNCANNLAAHLTESQRSNPAAEFVNKCLTRTGRHKKYYRHKYLRRLTLWSPSWNPLLLRRSHAGVYRLGGQTFGLLQRTLPHHGARSDSSIAPRATRRRRALR